MIGYSSRLRRDLERWHHSGIIDAETERAIQADISSRSRAVSLPGILSILGAILLSFAAMTFVAANWQDLSKLTRLTILFGAFWTSYAGAYLFQRVSMPYLSEAAILLASGMFGANIMLIAQMYHISGNPPDAVLMWACGVLLGGIVFQSRPALAFAVILFGLWSWWEVFQHDVELHVPYLIAWTACAIPIFWLRWRPGYHLQAISLTAWIIGLGFLLEPPGQPDMGNAHWLVIAMGLSMASVGLFLNDAIDRVTEFSKPLVIYGLAIAYAGLFSQQFIENTSSSGIAILALFTLILVLGTLYSGIHSDNRALTRFAYLLFCIELLALYFKTLGTLLDTALFFFIAGIIVIILATFAGYLNRRQGLNKGRAS
jgi:uncharacterized membrane protein